MKKTIEVYFHAYWFTTVLHIRKVPAVLYYLEKVCDKISDLLEPIPIPYDKFPNALAIRLPYYDDLGVLFWNQTSFRLIELMYKREKLTVIALPWRFAKELFPEEYEKYRKNRMYFEKDLKERINASVEAYKCWLEAYEKIQPPWLRERVNKLRG